MVMMHKRFLSCLLGALALAALIHLYPGADTRAESAGSTGGPVVRLDSRFDHLVPKDAVLERIADGFAWVEGPTWNRQGRYLLFSDIPNNAIMKWQDGAGVSLFLKPSGYTGTVPFEGRELGSNGLTFDSTGRLVLCAHGDRRITRLEEDPVHYGRGPKPTRVVSV
jgi:gluconolactonase